MEKIIGNREMHATVSSLGGIVTKLDCKKHEVIYAERPVGEKRRGGIPICFPFFGKPTGSFSEMSQHGWLRDQELNLVEESANKVVFVGKNQGSRMFPWLLEYKVTTLVNSNLLFISLETKRQKDGLGGRAPINPGFHPYFATLGKHLVKIGKNEIDHFKKPATLMGVQREFTVNNGKFKVRVVLGGDFGRDSVCALWSDDSEKYFCVEPILTPPRSFDTPSGKFLHEGEQLEIFCTLVVD